jgi:hypothetical protein
MTIVFKPSVIHPADMYRNSLWAAEECFRFYVEQRRQFCTYSEILDLWLQAPIVRIVFGLIRSGGMSQPIYAAKVGRLICC